MSRSIDFTPGIEKFKRLSEEQKQAAQEAYTAQLNAISSASLQQAEQAEAASEGGGQPSGQFQTRNSLATPFPQSMQRKHVDMTDEERQRAQEEYNRMHANRRY